MEDRPWYCVRQRAGPLTKECRAIRPRLSKAAAERPVLVYVICVDEDGQLYDPECGEWEMFFNDDFIADGIFDTTDNYGRTFLAFWDEPKGG